MPDGLVGRMEGYPTAENVHHPRCRRRHRGWSAVSSSLEPSPPTGHYCLVPYSVTNCFIKLKSHNPHCHDDPACRPFLLSIPSEVLSLLAPLYIRAHMPHRTVYGPLVSVKDVYLDCPSRLPSKIFSFSDLIKTKLDPVAKIKNNQRARTR